MNKIQIMRLASVIGALLVGAWMPLQLIEVIRPGEYAVAASFVITLISLLNIYLYFIDKDKNYREFKSWMNFGLIIDLLCAAPLYLLTFNIFGFTNAHILWLNCLVIRHIGQIKPFLDDFDNLQPIVYRIVPMMILMPVLVHLIACGWIFLGSGTAGIDADMTLTYAKAVYWTFTTLTTVGYGDISAKTISQMFFACGTQVIGVGVFGFILSNVASLLSRSDAAREHHMDNLDKIETFMRQHHTPDQLRTKIRAYYKYLWNSKKGYQDNSLISDLPGKLQSELFFVINKSIIERVPFLKGASSDLIEDLMNELEPRIYVPGEKIFKIDELGDALYFIHSGSVEILARDNQKIVQLNEGAFFGEMALISSNPRSATARAITFCDVYLLHKGSFDKVTRAYPEFKRHIEDVVQQRRAS